MLKDSIGKYLVESVMPLLEKKGISFVPATADPSGFISNTWDACLGDYMEWALQEGYRKNAAVFACISAIAFSFPRATLKVFDRRDNTPLPQHRAQLLLDTPNADMSQAEMNLYTSVYLPSGGNSYLHKLRNGTGNLVGLRPYSDAQVDVKPSQVNPSGIDSYRIRQANGSIKDIPIEDMIHLKWLAVDPLAPWMGLAPVRVVAREVNADSEATRYQQALLKNDAVPRGLLVFDKAADWDKELAEQARTMWKERYSDSNRGDIGVAPPGVSYERIGLNLEELAFDALRRVPETRIAAAMRVPAIIAGLNSGLDKSTYANFKEARQMFTEETLMPLWQMVANEIEQEFRKEWPEISVRFDTTGIPALQENADAVAIRQTRRAAQIHLMQVSYNKGELRREDAIANAIRALGVPEAEAEEMFVELETEEKTNELRTTVGGATAFQTLCMSYDKGEISREAAIALAINPYGFDPAIAPNYFPEKPEEPEPTPVVVPASNDGISDDQGDEGAEGNEEDDPIEESDEPDDEEDTDED